MQLNHAGCAPVSNNNKKQETFLMQYLAYVLTGLLFMVSCQDHTVPEGIIEQDKMVKLFTDIHLTDGILSTTASDSLLKQQAANYYNAVYKKYNTDSGQYKKSLRYYSMRPELLDTMYFQVSKNLQRLNDEMEKKAVDRNRDEAELALMNQDTTARPFKIMPMESGIFNMDTAGLIKLAKPDTTK